MFKLYKVRKSNKDLVKFGTDLISNLGDNLYDYKTMQELLYQVLAQISPINKTLELNDDSIEKSCKKIVKHFGFDNAVTIVRLGEREPKIIEPKKRSSTEIFCNFVIQLDKVPYSFYKILQENVSNDLLQITTLIKWYETDSFIQKLIKENETPRSHRDSKVSDFYKRCISERNEILDYFLNGIKERALAKSRYHPPFLFGMMRASEIFHDYPYMWAIPNSISYFDYREIDLSAHRIGELPYKEALKMQKLYKVNKTKFYKDYFKSHPSQAIFNSFELYLKDLPLDNNRDVIFKELKRSFKAKQWISFYALALPQVEGLFSEMCLIISPDKNLSQKSLPQKVSAVRPFHPLSSSYFDYYEYHIPFQRNQFAHTGYDDDFKLKSFDLFLDLNHILKVFHELDNPLIKIKQLHNRRNPNDFISLADFTNYFKLLNDLKPQQRINSKDEIDKFESDFLTVDCEIQFICYEFAQNLPLELKEFVDSINRSFMMHRINIDFSALNISDIKKLISAPENFETLNENCNLNYHLVEHFKDYSIFMVNVKKHLPSLNSTLKDIIEKSKSDHGKLLDNFIQTFAQLEKNN